MHTPTTFPHPPSLRSKWAALAAVSLLAVATPAQAQGVTDGWQFEASIYGWFPGISGTTSFAPDGGGPSIDASMGDVIDALKFALMGTVQARKGRWGLWTDLVYADIGGSRQGSRDFAIGGHPLPAGLTGDLTLDLKAWVWTLNGLYALKSDDEGTMDMLFGTRMLDMTTTLGWSLNGTGPGVLPPLSGTKKVSQTNWDAVVGLKGRANLGGERKWFVPYYVDLGTGESKFTWQANAGVGYSFGWGSLIASWRYLHYDFKSGGHVESLSFNGPLVGAVFKF